MLNISSLISKHNNKILKQNSHQNLQQNLSNRQLAERGASLCNCRDKNTCPMPDKCVNSNVVYKYSVTRSDTSSVETYTGATVNFKERHGTHMKQWKMTPKIAPP